MREPRRPSEDRAIAETAIVDPVCGRPVDPLRARAVGIYGGQTRYFCSAGCKAEYARSGLPSVAAPTPPPPVLHDVPVIAARPPALARPVERVAASPRPRPWSGPFVIAAIVIAATSVAVWLRPRSPAPIASSPVVAATQPAAPVLAAPAPIVTPAGAASVPSYDGSLKLGLRRFAEGSAWSLRLLIIDEAGTPTVTTIASGEGQLADGAVAPAPDFARSRREPGIVFEDEQVEVERRPTALVVRSRTGAGAWSEKVVARLTETTALRAAPFARARYE